MRTISFHLSKLRDALLQFEFALNQIEKLGENLSLKMVYLLSVKRQTLRNLTVFGGNSNQI